MRSITMIVALAALAAAAPAAAQFAGKWEVELGEWHTEEGGNVQIRGANSGRLDLTVRADSVVGTWVGAQGSPAPLELRGRPEGGKVVLTGTREAVINLNGEERTELLEVVYELSPSADGLEGVMRLQRPGAPPVWRSLKARRAA